MCENNRTRPFLPRLASGDLDAFWSFYQQFSPCAAKSAWTLQEHDRVDCVFDAFENIFWKAQGLTKHRRKKVKPLSDLTGTYVHGAVKLEKSSRWKRANRHRKIEAALAQIAPAESHPPDAFDLDDLLSDAGLTAEEKRIVELAVQYRCTLEEIAQQIGAPLQTVHTRYRQVRQRIRRYLDDESQDGDTVPSG